MPTVDRDARERSIYPITVLIAAGTGDYLHTTRDHWPVTLKLGECQRHINHHNQPWYAWRGATHGNETTAELYTRAHAALCQAYPEDDIPAPEEGAS